MKAKRLKWRAETRQDGHTPFYAIRLSFFDPEAGRWFDAPEQRTLGSRYARALLSSLGLSTRLPKLEVFRDPASEASHRVALAQAKREVVKLKKGRAA